MIAARTRTPSRFDAPSRRRRRSRAGQEARAELGRRQSAQRVPRRASAAGRARARTTGQEARVSGGDALDDATAGARGGKRNESPAASPGSRHVGGAVESATTGTAASAALPQRPGPATSVGRAGDRRAEELEAEARQEQPARLRSTARSARGHDLRERVAAASL
jgi:hypothetical protein